MVQIQQLLQQELVQFQMNSLLKNLIAYLGVRRFMQRLLLQILKVIRYHHLQVQELISLKYLIHQ